MSTVTQKWATKEKPIRKYWKPPQPTATRIAKAEKQLKNRGK